MCRASSQHTKLQHRFHAPYPELCSCVSSVYHYHRPGHVSSQLQKNPLQPSVINQHNLQASPQLDSYSICINRFILGKCLSTQQPASPLHPPHKTIFHQRRNWRFTIRISRAGTGDIYVYLPLCYLLSLGYGCETQILAGMEDGRISSYCSLVGANWGGS